MHILIAPNAFKNSLDAAAAANAIGEGLLQSALQCSLEYFPIGDGGDGTAALIIEKQKGNIINTKAHDALGREIDSCFGLIDNDTTAVIEMADASGIRLLKQDELNPMRATSFGTGELIVQALDKKVNKIILCIGGSATVDGGTGILQALGIQFLNDKNEVLNHLPADLTQLASIDSSGLNKRIQDIELVILCDVENTLLGSNGSASVFGPQKGASAEDIIKLEAALSAFRNITLQQIGIDIADFKHGGAAGGVAAGLAAFCNAKLVNGIDYFLSITDFDTALKTADIVITGEGKIDEQTLQGKGPYGVALRAKEKGVPVIGVAGSVPLEINAQLQEYFSVLTPINNQAEDLQTAMQHTAQNLTRTGKMIGDMLHCASLTNDI